MQTSPVYFLVESEVREAIGAAFDRVRAILDELLPEARVEHIGATSVPGSLTKGDLDVCVLVQWNEFARADHVLAQRFERNIGSERTDSLSSFVDHSADVPVGIQLVARGGTEDDFVRWRELLRHSPQLLSAYNDLKRHWHGAPHDRYRAAKSRFIEDTLSSASPVDDG